MTESNANMFGIEYVRTFLDGGTLRSPVQDGEGFMLLFSTEAAAEEYRKAHGMTEGTEDNHYEIVPVPGMSSGKSYIISSREDA